MCSHAPTIIAAEPTICQDTGELLDDKPNWPKYKCRARSVIKVYEESGSKKKAARMRQCGSTLVFRECPNGHEKRLQSANFCREKLCPMCQWRKSLMTFHQVQELCHVLHERQPSVRFVLLTLTVPNYDATELSDGLTEMFSGWQRLSQRKEVKRAVLGWFRALEVTYNSDREDYHPHFHALLAVRSKYFADYYITRDRWLELWQESMRDDSITQVDVRAIRPNAKRKGSDAISAAAAEVAKYATKSDDYLRKTKEGYEADNKVILTLDSALHNRRLLAFGGVLKQIRAELKQQDVETADLVHVDGEQVNTCTCSVCGSTMWDHVYRWRPGLNNYVG